MLRSNFSNEVLKKIFWTAVFALYSGLIFYVSIYPFRGTPSPIIFPGADKLIHAGEFTLFFLIGYQTILYYTKNEGKLIWTLGLTTFYGGITELAQLAFVYRTASLIDWGADILGAVIGLLIILLIEKWKVRNMLFDQK